ncbi:MAG: hypothetical protein LBI47_03275 [Puniceicoccales bacterium]|jgi:hypothetical protein|nr:hypothetical protein [Puniceicoccales bacterium]
MQGTKKIQSAQSYGQSAAIPEEVDGSGKPVVVGGAKVSIPRSMVPEGVLRARSARAASVPPVVPPILPVCWLDFTMENTAKLSKDKIAQLLLSQSNPDFSKFGTVLFLPDGERIAIRLINGMPGDFILELIGQNVTSANSFTRIFFEKKYFVDQDAGKDPTVADMRNSVLAGCEPLPPDLQKGNFEKQVDIAAWRMRDVFCDVGQRREFEGKLRNIVDLIVRKLPQPNEGNQKYWNTIHEAIEAAAYKLFGTGDRRELIRIQKEFPMFKFKTLSA